VPRPFGPNSTVLLTEAAPRRACVDIGYGPHCETAEIRGTEWDGFDRRLRVAAAGTWNLSGTVVARADAAAAALLGPLDDAAIATADSVYGGDPAVSAVFAFDGRAETSWLASPDDDRATLTLTWKGERTVSRLAVDRVAGVPTVAPVRARIESSSGVRDVSLTGFGYFQRLRARDGLSITFYKPSAPASFEAGLPLGIGEVRVDGLEGLQHEPSLDSPTGAVCGLGPEVRIDGTVHRTEVTGTLRDVVAGRPLGWRVCDGPLSLGPGVHRLVAEATAQFQPLSLTWRPAEGVTATTVDQGDRLRVASWGQVRRS
jgi:arabinofuranan 3-O-arabinosyltransferase